jgi:hypothetical protein
LSPEQFAAILLALAAVFGAVARCIAELRSYHSAVNSKMDALLELTATASLAEGKLLGEAKPSTPLPSARAGKLPLDPWSKP